jgi:hypothetical protein
VTTFDHTRTTICDAIIDGVTFEKLHHNRLKNGIIDKVVFSGDFKES